MTQVFLYQNGQQVGPYQVEDLQNWIQTGQLKITDQAWFEGCPNWVTLAEVPGIILPQGGQGDRTADVPPFAAYEGEDAYLFISYSHQDAHLVYPEMHQLRDAGYNIWYDEGVAASNEWPEEIAKAVLGCSVFVCFISPRATESINCRNEINLALNEKKPFLAIHLEETELPPGLRLRMGDLQAVIKDKISPDRYLSKIISTLDQLLGRKAKVNLGAVEKASSLFVSRDGQTFGPYTFEQATQYLQAGQLLASDYAMLEGQSEWKLLPEVLNALKEASTRHSMAITADIPRTGSATSPKQKTTKKKDSVKKSVKVRGMNARTTNIKVKEKSLVSKLIATVAVFMGTGLVVCGSTLGAYLVAPSQVGPIVRKFGVPIEQWFPGREADSAEIIQAPPGTLQDVSLAPEQWHHLRSSGITLMPIEGADGLQVISPVDPKLAMNDDDLKILQYIAQHLVILDLTNSQVTDEGLAVLQKFPNLKKLILEGSEKITSAGVRNISTIPSLELVNLIRLKLDDSVVDILSGMGGLQQVFLYQTGLSSEAIQKLKDTRPRMFVNAG
tara:strand:- start:84 stop:1754 length:1671 start_codon:yes stop_codon:yes gene_type:complete